MLLGRMWEDSRVWVSEEGGGDGEENGEVDGGRVLVVEGSAVAVRCLPAWTRRRDSCGMEVRSERREVRVEMVVDGGSVKGITG